MVNIKLEGVNELISYFDKLPTNLDRELAIGNEQFVKDIKKSAKLRAPKDTGATKDSIIMTKTKSKGKRRQWKLEAGKGAPQAIYQEYGFTPHVAMIGPSPKIPVATLAMVSKFTPFIQPAVEHNLIRLNSQLNNSVDKALRS